MNIHSDKHVAILLCCYHGKKFIKEQIESILHQTHKNLSLWVSIDGEDDGTKEIIQKQTKGLLNGKVHFFKGPGKGYALNFWSLLCHSTVKADYYAFCDQDDIWEEHKMTRALEFLEVIARETPALYCSQSHLINEKGDLIGTTLGFKRKPGFRNALVQSIAAGNTMVFNDFGRRMISDHFKNINCVSHDWMVYLIISAIGGTIVYDLYPSLKYRQHPQNLIGESRSFSAYLRRVCSLMKGRLHDWIDINLKELEKNRHLLTKKNQRVFDIFNDSRNKGVLRRLFGLWNAGLYRLTFFQNVGLYFACIFKRI